MAIVPLARQDEPLGPRGRFKGREAFRPTKAYQLLPFRFLRLDSADVLLVNEVGEHLILESGTFTSFLHHTLSPDDESYLDLKGKHFLHDSDSTVPLDLLSVKYRTKKAHLEGFTKLHIFVVTLRCEHSCQYCQVSRVTADKARFDMTPETAENALAFALRSPAPRLKIEFQGGEPLLHFDRIAHVVERAGEHARMNGREVEFVVASNLALLSDDMLGFFRRHKVALSVSLDGPAFIHNSNRPRPEGDSHELTIRNVRRAREALGADRVSALMTTTRLSLDHPCAIVDEYARQGFHTIFLRSLSPYGFALRTARRIGYETDRFLRFYVAGLDRILEVNRQGYHLVEVYAQLLLTRMLTPFATGYVDLQSPSGAGIAAAVYNYDGDIYASDEGRMLAEMGDKRYRLGNVHEDSYEAVFGSAELRQLVRDSCVESMPGCSDCAFQPWCGADPTFHYATQGDPVGHRPSSDFHLRNSFIIRHLFDLYRHNADARRIFWGWIRGIPVPDASLTPVP